MEVITEDISDPNWPKNLKGIRKSYNLTELNPSTSSISNVKDSPKVKADFLVNGLKARSTKRIEIPVILSKDAIDPQTKKAVFDTYDGPISSTFEFQKSETSTEQTFNTLLFMKIEKPK